MKWYYKIQRKYGHLGVDNLMLYITVTMLAVYLADMLLELGFSSYLYFRRDLIFEGQVWRAISFAILPPASGSPVFLLLSLYFYYFIGDALEKAWGTFQFNFYYLCGIIGTAVGGFVAGSTGNHYLNLSLFFAFAQLFPESRVNLFFVIPVKIKYLAAINWVFFIGSFFTSLVYKDFASCVAIAMSLLNFFLFFGREFIDGFKSWRRYSKRRSEFRRQMNNDINFWRQQ